MQHEYDGAPLFGQGTGCVHYGQLVRYVEEGGGLVHQDAGSLLRERHGQVRALALSAGELGQALVGYGQSVGALERALRAS